MASSRFERYCSSQALSHMLVQWKAHICRDMTPQTCILVCDSLDAPSELAIVVPCDCAVSSVVILHAVRNEAVDSLAIVPSPPKLIFQLDTFSTGERARVRGKECTVFWFILTTGQPLVRSPRELKTENHSSRDSVKCCFNTFTHGDQSCGTRR